ncbi:hypothetical protein [Neisseria sp. Marseille-Q6792]|uniref:hypothetical protein n=1 Tax=Neisseria sp. Marseille-Q6792 TaxID=2937985 RepID=UPI0020241659|nr:hypothetical protein [Neisseria sp. Marseille-Q6792]
MPSEPQMLFRRHFIIRGISNLFPCVWIPGRFHPFVSENPLISVWAQTGSIE